MLSRRAHAAGVAFERVLYAPEYYVADDPGLARPSGRANETPYNACSDLLDQLQRTAAAIVLWEAFRQRAQP